MAKEKIPKKRPDKYDPKLSLKGTFDEFIGDIMKDANKKTPKPKKRK